MVPAPTGVKGKRKPRARGRLSASRGHRLNPSLATRLLTLAVLMALVVMVVFFTRKVAAPTVAWPDECIYLASARNINERGSLDTNFYLTYSILARGYPHRDVHMPGYVL